MSRSVEIPEEAVEAAMTACRESDFAWSSEGIHDEYWRKMGRASLSAALPYLAPAEPPVIDRGVLPKVKQAKRRLWAGLMAVKPKLDEPYPDDARWTPWTRFVGPRLDDLWAAFDALLLAAGEARPEAPAGDGGLREALEKALESPVELWHENSFRVKALPETVLRELLAAHPAAPAVPQPADEARTREHLDSCVWIDPGRQSGQPCFGGTRVPVAPFMAIVDEAGEDAAKAFWPSVTDAHIKAGRAWQAAVPQPVDREALERGVAAYIDEHGSGDEHPVDMIRDISDAIQAVLAGEQEQAEQ